MGAARGVANLIIRDKRADGYITAHAWGLDFPMTGLDRTRQVAGPYQNAAHQRPEWDLDEIVAIPELNAAILTPYWSTGSLDLDWWEQESSAYWKIVRPPGAVCDWIKWYDGRADQYGSICSRDRLSYNPSFGLRFLRARPPADQTNDVEFAVTLNALGTIQYQLYIRQNEGYYPSLWKSTDAGATWDDVDYFANEQAARWAAGAFERIDYISCIFLPDHLIIWLGDMPNAWVYYEDGLHIPEGHIRMEVAGCQTAFHLQQVPFATSGAIERLIGITAPGFINDVADTMDHLGQTPAGATITPTMQTGGGEVWPKAVLAGDATRTPVLYQIQATRPATHAAGTTTVLFDNTLAGHKGKLISLRYTIGQAWRGSRFSAQLETAGGYDFDGNEKAEIKVARDTGGGLSYVTQMTAYLQRPKRLRHGRDPGTVVLDLQGQDRLCRLRNKAALLLPSFAGWSFQDAWTWLMHECAGILESELVFDGGAADFHYPCPYSDLILKFDHTLDVVAVADQLAKAAGREWGITAAGKIFSRALGTIAYSGSPDWTLDEDTATEADVAYTIEADRDIFSVRNHVMVIGRDKHGNDVLATWRHDPSVSNPAADPFIGDTWWDVSIAPDGADPWLIAQFRGTDLLSYRSLVVWQTDGKPDLFPDHYVKVQTTGLEIPNDTIFRIIEKQGELRGDGEFTTRFLGVIQ